MDYLIEGQKTKIMIIKKKKKKKRHTNTIHNPKCTLARGKSLEHLFYIVCLLVNLTLTYGYW